MRKWWTRLNLSQKIILPFLIVCLSIFGAGLPMLGYWFTDVLEQNFRTEVETFADRVHQDFQAQQHNLEAQIKLLAYYDTVRQAIEQQDKTKLRQILLPLRTVLGLDWIKVVDTQGNTLVEIFDLSVHQANLLAETISSSASSGAEYADLVDTKDHQQMLQVVIHPIKSPAGLVGGVIVGQLVDDALLQKIASGSSKQLISLRERQIVAATSPDIKNAIWQPSTSDQSVVRVTLDRQVYLAKSFVFAGASQSFSTTVLYPIALLETAKFQLWLQLVMLFLITGVVVVIVGVAIAKTITRPLIAVTQIARQVTQNANFDLQAPVKTNDEIGVVASSLNQLIRQVKQLLVEQQQAHKNLAAYSQTLEQKVEERTQELQQRNIELQQTLQELGKTQTQLIQTEKMSSLGQLIAGVAHEINNPVGFIHGNLAHVNQYTQNLLDLLQVYQQVHLNSAATAIVQQKAKEIDFEFLIQDLPHVLESMQVGTNRIKQIVLSLRNFSRMDEAEKKTVDLHEGIDSTLMILQHRLKAHGKNPGVQVIKQYGNLPKIECYAGQLNQVFMNLLSNAIDALQEAHEAEACSTPTIQIVSERVNEMAMIRITDNGLGIPEALQQRIFDPFFTTKPVGQGTGLGLSISYQIVAHKHGGLLQCISTPSQGTTFVIEIPIRSIK